MTKIFKIKEVVNYSWEKVKKHLGFFILLSIIVFLISYIPGIVNELTTKQSEFSAIGLLSYLIFWVLQIIVSIGVIRICLDIVYDKTQEPKIKNLFSHTNLFIKYLIASLLYGIGMMIPVSVVMGLFMLAMILKLGVIVKIILAILGIASLVFTIIYSVRFSYYQYYIVEGFKVIDSFKNSYKITKNLVWSLMVLYFVLGLINLLGLMCLFVGLLVTVPLSYIGTTFVYKKIKEANSGLIEESLKTTPITEEIK